MKNPDAPTTLPGTLSGSKRVADALNPIDSAFIACGSSGDTTWTTTSATFDVIRSCTLMSPRAGYLFISVSASAGLSGTLSDSEYEGRFRIAVDNADGDVATDRWLNVYAGAGTDKTVADSLLTEVTTGTHTVSFIGARYAGPGSVTLHAPALSVLYIPAGETDLRACGAARNAVWTTVSASFTPVRSCQIDAPQAGWVFVTASASLGLSSAGSNSEYEGRFRVGVDSAGGDLATDRWVNVYRDAGDGTDENVEASVLSHVTPGDHVFSFLGARHSGSGTVLLYDPTLSVIFIPEASVTAKVCGSVKDGVWSTVAASFARVRSCSFDVPQAGWAFVSASASVGLSAIGAGNDYSGRFRIGVDNLDGDAATDRWVNVYADAGEGADKTLATSWLTAVSAGPHTFSFLGARHVGPGAVFLDDAVLFVLVPGSKNYLPILLYP